MYANKRKNISNASLWHALEIQFHITRLMFVTTIKSIFLLAAIYEHWRPLAFSFKKGLQNGQ